MQGSDEQRESLLRGGSEHETPDATSNFSDDVIGVDRSLLGNSIETTRDLVHGLHSADPSASKMLKLKSSVKNKFRAIAEGTYRSSSWSARDQLEGGDMADSEMMANLKEEEVALMAMQDDLRRRTNKKQSGASPAMNTSTLSTNSIGEEKTFKEVRQSQIDQEIKELWTEMALDSFLLTLIIILIAIDISRSKQGDCSNPVREWVLVFFIIWLSKSTVSLLKIPVLKTNYKGRLTANLYIYFAANGLLVVWLIAGNYFYFSEAKDCPSAWSIVMLIILIVGYFVIFFYLAMILLMPCLFMQVSRLEQEEDRDENGKLKTSKVPLVLKTMSKT